MTHEQIAAMVNRLKLAKITGCRAAYALLGATPLDKINADIAAAADLIEAQAAELERLREALTEITACLDGSPDYHTQGMGCGLEDRGITDRYDAMQYGWDEALDRVYSEHVSGALDVAYAAMKGGA